MKRELDENKIKFTMRTKLKWEMRETGEKPKMKPKWEKYRIRKKYNEKIKKRWSEKIVIVVFFFHSTHL